MAGYPNYYFPQNYPQMQMQQQMAQPQVPVQQNGSDIVWVQGEAGAKAFPVGAGKSVLLMDTEDNVLYIKTVDMSGMPQPLRIFDLKERTGQSKSSNAVANTADSVSRQEFEELREEVKRISKGVRKPVVKEEEDDAE